MRKLKEFSFRDINKKFVLINHMYNVSFASNHEGLSELLLGYFFIDYNNGICLQLIGEYENDIIKEFMSSGNIVQIELLNDCEIEILDSNLYKDDYDFITDAIDMFYHYDSRLEMLRNDKRLDAFRHKDYPDDVLVMCISNDGRSEGIWARYRDYKKSTKEYLLLSLNDAYFVNIKQNDLMTAKIMKDSNGKEYLVCNS